MRKTTGATVWNTALRSDGGRFMLEKYLNELKKIRMLSPEEEKELWARAANGDERAHRKLTESYQPLVFKTAAQFHLPEEVTMELIQEGTVGLLEASESYDHTRGVAFSLYAVHRIGGRMRDFLKREFTHDEVFLDRETLQERFFEKAGVSFQWQPEEAAERHAVAERVSRAVDRLPQKEKLVLRGIFLENKEPAALAEDIHVSLSHVYRLEKKGIRRIRGMLSRFMSEFKK